MENIEYMQYMDMNFDIRNTNNFGRFSSLSESQNYLDFAIFSTIRKQLPNVSPESEKKSASEILTRYMSGTSQPSFTRQYNIRNNIDALGKGQIMNIFIKMMIERDAYNKRVKHQLAAQSYRDQCCEYITQMTANGQVDQIGEWLNSVIPELVDTYVSEVYRQDSDIRNRIEEISYQDPLTNKALEKLNLEMNIKSLAPSDQNYKK